jgi:hypothetical protein
MVPAAFPRPDFDTPLHPELKRRLDATADLLRHVGAAAVLSVIRTVGGTNIRNNVNSSSALSNHSFGWAADFDPELNPNIKKKVLPLALIKAFTGVELYGAESTVLRTSDAYDRMLTAAKVLSDASHVFQTAMSSAVGLHAAMGRAIAWLTGVTISDTDVDTVFTAATRSPADAARIAATLRNAGVPANAATAAAALLIAAAKLMAKAIKTVKPTIIGSAATIARFGFLNHPPEFVAAMVSSQGGGLRWLGAADGTKDFMHFELYPADQPKRY